MRYLFILPLFFSFFTAKAQIAAQHCGYDFTSYLVLDVHENGKKETIKDLKITIVDSAGNDVINLNNTYSWTNANKALVFSLNYKIDDSGKKITAETDKNAKSRWFFPFAKENYLLSVANTFPAENFSIKVEDTDGKANGGLFKTQIVPLNSYNMYVLCSAQNERQAMQFGPRTNRPVEIILDKQ